ncbi:MAG: redoxin domain-containing protein [Actinobacteria bacterium]|nr:redoxin domain-containing protein [Actinomycetota bacterium]
MSFDGESVTSESLAGKRSLFCFYPFAFSGVCTDQFSVYQGDIEQFKQRGVDLYAISVDALPSANAFKESLGVTDITFLADFEPKGQVAQAFGTYREGGFNDRSVFLIEPDGTIGWSKKMPTPGEFPGTDEVIAGIDAASA